MADLGFLEEIDHSKLPNWTANAADYAVGQWFDPDNTYSLWWQGGTGTYRLRPRGHGTRVHELRGPARPRVRRPRGRLQRHARHVRLDLLSLGNVPENATIEDVTAAQQVLLEANERGQFRGYYDNSYYDALAAGDLVVRGLVRGRDPDGALRQPERAVRHPAGACSGTNLCIPKGSTERLEQYRFQIMDYRYDRAGHPAVGVHRLLHRRRRSQ